MFYLFFIWPQDLRRPIAMKLCHVISIGADFIMQVQQLGDPPYKILGPKHAKFGPILHNFLLWLWISPQQLKISKIGKPIDWLWFLPHSKKPVRWTLVHYPETLAYAFGPPKSTFSGDYISALFQMWKEQLQKLGLTTLKKRRQRGDMIEVFKLLAGVENNDCNQFFMPATTGYALRRHHR